MNVVPSYDVAVGLQADRYRYEKRVRMEVDVIPRRQQIGGALVPHGKNLVDVPESTVADVMKLVCDAGKLAAAETRLKTEIENHHREHGETALHAFSIGGVFRHMHGHEMGALRSAKVVEEDLPPPLSIEERKAAAIAQAVQETPKRSPKSKPSSK